MNHSLPLTQHARIRMQQRGIPSQVLEWLSAYGEIDHQRGAELYYFSRRSREALQRHEDPATLRRYAKALNAYMVCTEGRVSTVGHRYQRVVRH
jgi:hypothetical protein